MMREHYPIVVVGAGPAGLTLANLLGTLGVETLLVERNSSTVGEPRAVSIDDESLRTMQSLGLIEEIQGALVAGYGSHYFAANGHCFAKVEPTGQPYGYPRRNAFRQPILERQLRHGLGRFPSVTCRFSCAMTKFNQGPSAVHVELLDGDGTGHRVSCDYLIGCDGASSTVRKALGITLEGTTFSERWLIIDLENCVNETMHTKVFCDPRRPCIMLPGPSLTRRYEFKIHDGEREEDVLHPRMIERLLGAHSALPRSTLRRKAVYTFHARIAPRWQVGRVFLAGDSAHLTPPFAGQGMNSGIRDVQNLAWKLAAVLRGRAGMGLLETYEIERRDHAWQMIQLALRMGRIMAPRSRFAAWLHESIFGALQLYPPARDYVAHMKYKPKPRVKRGFLVADGRPSRRTLVGRMFPQAILRCNDGALVLLDDLLGNNFAMLAYEEEVADIEPLFGLPLWDTLACRRLLILGRSAASIQPPVATAVDESGALAASFSSYRHHVLLLRPDRYVAAAIPLSKNSSAIGTIERLLAETWKDTDGSDVAGRRLDRADHLGSGRAIAAISR
jgi:3-(3-hydroxy-phenyl)propionate hydroxylase